jgi:hypothetical protein
MKADIANACVRRRVSTAREKRDGIEDPGVGRVSPACTHDLALSPNNPAWVQLQSTTAVSVNAPVLHAPRLNADRSVKTRTRISVRPSTRERCRAPSRSSPPYFRWEMDLGDASKDRHLHHVSQVQWH